MLDIHLPRLLEEIPSQVRNPNDSPLYIFLHQTLSLKYLPLAPVTKKTLCKPTLQSSRNKLIRRMELYQFPLKREENFKTTMKT